MKREKGNPKTKTSNLCITCLQFRKLGSLPNRRLGNVSKGDCLNFSVCISFTLKTGNEEKQKYGSVSECKIFREYCQDHLTLEKDRGHTDCVYVRC